MQLVVNHQTYHGYLYKGSQTIIMKGGKTLWMQPVFQNATVKVSETDPRHQAVSMCWSNLEDGQEKSNDQPHDTHQVR